MYLLALKKGLYLVSLKACDIKNVGGWFHPRILISRLTKVSTWNMQVATVCVVCPSYLSKVV